MSINLKDDIPVQSTYSLFQKVKNYIQELLLKGWIIKSKSPYTAPVVCVWRKDGSLCLCIRTKTTQQKNEIPWSTSITQEDTGPDRHFGLLHLVSSREGLPSRFCFWGFLTVYYLHDALEPQWIGLYLIWTNERPCSIPKGMEETLGLLRDECWLPYLDDIHGVRLKPEKLELFKSEVRYVGWILTTCTGCQIQEFGPTAAT